MQGLTNNKREVGVLCLLLAGLAITMFGITEIELVSPWSGTGLRDLGIVVFLIFVLSVSLPSKWLFGVLAWVWCVYIFSMAGVQTLVAPFVVSLAGFYFGSRLCLFINRQVDDKRLPSVSVQLAVGLALITLVFQMIVRLPVNYSSVYWSVLSVPAILAVKELVSRVDIAIFESLKVTGYQERFAFFLFLVGLTLHIIVATKPEIGHDGLAYRLWMPTTISAMHIWPYDVSNGVNVFTPNGAETMFSIGYMLGGEIAARFLNLVPLLVVLALLYESVSAGSRSKKVMFLSVFLSTPLLGLESGNLFGELYWMLYLFASLLVAVNERLAFETRWLLVSILVAAALVTKVLTVFVLPVLFLVLIWQWGSQRRRVQFASWLILVFISPLACFPYITSYYYTGNPVFPFFNDLFKSPHFWSEQAFTNEIYSQSLDWLRLLYNLNFDAGKFLEATPGAFGFQWLLIVPLLFTSRKNLSASSIIFGCFAIALFLGVFSNQAYLRYIIPVLPIIVLLVSRATSDWNWHVLKGFFFALMVAVTSLNFFYFASSGWSHKQLFAFDFYEYERQHAPEKLFADYLSVKEPDASVLMIGRFYGAGFTGIVRGDNWYFYDTANQTRGLEFDLLEFLKSKGHKYVVTSRTELSERAALKVQIERDLDVEWSIGGHVLYVLPERSRFQTELLQNPDLKDQIEPWLGADFEFESGNVTVEGAGLLYQSVKLSSVREHKLTYTVSCIANTDIRLQVNWFDEDHAFVATSIKVQSCSGERLTFGQEVEPPLGAFTAIVYAQSHDDKPIVFHRVSLLE